METIQERKTWTLPETENFYRKLLEKALNSIPETGASMVLGPMFIIRTPEENFSLFEKAQSELKEKGLEIFNQLTYLDYILGEAPFDYKTKFDIFYKALIESGKITACYILPDWEKSEGTKSEIEYCKKAGVPVFEISTNKNII